ncbi:MAG: M43 family zinc metalloprotease [Bacteroidia bacterium]
MLKKNIQLKLAILLLSASSIAFTQNSTPSINCDNTFSNTNKTYAEKYRKIETYIPDENTAIKHIRIAVNVFVGAGTMQASDSTKKAIEQMVYWINEFYANVDSPSYAISGVPWIKDTKIRFDLDDRIYFYENSKLHNSTSINILEKYIAGIDKSRLNNLNIYITDAGKSSPYSISPFPDFMGGLSGSHPTSMDGNMGLYISTKRIFYANAQTLAHEIAHSLDLLHTYEPSCCHETCDDSNPEYMYDLFGTNPPDYCWERGHFGCEITPGENTCTNNIMGGNNLVRYYFSPMQIGKMHRALSIKSVRKYVKENVMDNKVHKIKNDELWNFDVRWYSAISIESGTTLTITGKLLMPPNAEITVKRGAKLVLDAGVIKSSGANWKGVKIKKSNNAFKRLFGKDGVVEIKNDGSINNIN